MWQVLKFLSALAFGCVLGTGALILFDVLASKGVRLIPDFGLCISLCVLVVYIIDCLVGDRW